MLGAIRSGHGGMQKGLGLPKVQMAPHPFAVAMIADVAHRPARRARQLAVMMGDEDVGFLLRNINIDATDVPGMMKAQKSGVDLGIGHASEDANDRWLSYPRDSR